MGKTRRGGGAGVGDQWVKLREWELGDHCVIEICCFDSKLKWVKANMQYCPDSKTDLIQGVI